jgi:thymidylate synthase
MIKADKYYIENLNNILEEMNTDVNPRPSYKDGTPAHSYFISQVFEKYDLSKGEFPITTLRNTAVKTGIREILWIYSKQSASLEEANKLNINWWSEWEVGNTNTIGQRYGATVKKWDLMNKLIYSLESNPFGRRHHINLLQESDLMATEGLYPCAYGTLWTVRKKDNKMYLDMTLTQRSQDAIMATYINKIQYVALQMMVACHLGYEVGTFAHFVQNYHIYDRHLEACHELLSREVIDFQPYIKLNAPIGTNFYDITLDDFEIVTSKEIKKIESELEIAV